MAASGALGCLRDERESVSLCRCEDAGRGVHLQPQEGDRDRLAGHHGNERREQSESGGPSIGISSRGFDRNT